MLPVGGRIIRIHWLRREEWCPWGLIKRQMQRQTSPRSKGQAQWFRGSGVIEKVTTKKHYVEKKPDQNLRSRGSPGLYNSDGYPLKLETFKCRDPKGF